MTHAPASPSAAPSASEQRASGIREPSLPPAPAGGRALVKEAAGQRAVHTPLCPILRRCPGPMRARIKELGSQSTKSGPAPVRPPQGLPRAGRAVCHRPPSALFLLKQRERERESSNPHSRFSPCQRGLQAWANEELEPPCR